MARWSNMEKTVGVLAEKFPQNDLSYWLALRAAVDYARGTMQDLDNRFALVENNAELSDVGKAKARADIAEQALRTLNDCAALKKARGAVARRIENLREKIGTMSAPTEPADIALAGEIRSLVRMEANPSAFAFANRTNKDLVRAITSGPAFLSGMTDQEVERLRKDSLLALHPEEAAEIESLTWAEGVAQDAVKLAAERIAKRGGVGPLAKAETE
jgi:hypothetical protein